MSIDAMKWAWKSDIQSSGALFVLLVLADRGGSEDDLDDWTCFPSVAFIAERTRLEERQVRRHLQWLLENGWISKAPRGVRKADKGKFVYTLHRARLGRSPDILSGKEGGVSPDTMSGGESQVSADNMSGEDGQVSADNMSGEGSNLHRTSAPVSPDISDKGPPNPLKEPVEPSLNPHSRRAGGQATPVDVGPEFGAVFEAFAVASPTSVARPRDEAAWRAAVQRVEPGRLALAAPRYLAEVIRIKGRVFSLERWLRDAKWEPFLEAPAEPVVVARSAWPGPPDVRAQLVAKSTDRLAGLYLDRAGWDAGRRVILAADDRDAQTLLRSLGGRVLEQLGISAIIGKGEA